MSLPGAGGGAAGGGLALLGGGGLAFSARAPAPLPPPLGVPKSRSSV
ncbi:MAG TPA: hypothetical protein PLW65_26245 [Pseudomonadota bacterium]|nr:hypothetical protein [Pseudomonadota bacterium]